MSFYGGKFPIGVLLIFLSSSYFLFIIIFSFYYFFLEDRREREKGERREGTKLRLLPLWGMDFEGGREKPREPKKHEKPKGLGIIIFVNDFNEL